MFFTEEKEVLMTKITEQDRSLMISQLRELSKLAMKANIKHHTVLDKNATHTNDLTKIIKEDRAKIARLENVIKIRDRQIDDLNAEKYDLLFEVGKLEKEKEVDEANSAQVQKHLSKKFNLESTDH